MPEPEIIHVCCADCMSTEWKLDIMKEADGDEAQNAMLIATCAKCGGQAVFDNRKVPEGFYIKGKPN